MHFLISADIFYFSYIWNVIINVSYNAIGSFFIHFNDAFCVVFGSSVSVDMIPPQVLHTVCFHLHIQSNKRCWCLNRLLISYEVFVSHWPYPCPVSQGITVIYLDVCKDVRNMASMYPGVETQLTPFYKRHLFIEMLCLCLIQMSLNFLQIPLNNNTPPPSHYHHCANLSEDIELIKCLSDIFCRVCEED